MKQTNKQTNQQAASKQTKQTQAYNHTQTQTNTNKHKQTKQKLTYNYLSIPQLFIVDIWPATTVSTRVNATLHA